MKTYENIKLSPEERAKALLDELSLDEKMAQINCYWFGREGSTNGHEDDIKYGIGVVSCLEMRGVKYADAVKRRNEIQRQVMENSPHRIPAIFHMEGLCGLLHSDATCFPSGISRGASFDAPLEREIGKWVGDQAAASGITHVFAPVLDITRDARFGRMYESYGEDATLAAQMGVEYAEGVQDNAGREVGVEGVAKHFLGFHRGAGGLHGTDCAIGERELREVYAKPFEAAFRMADLKGVMPCYNVINGELASASEYILTDLLRGELGFDGVAVSDYCAIMNMMCVNRLAENEAQAGLRALQAGMDVEQQHPFGYGEALKEKFASGEADIAVLNRAVLRVLTAKFRMGLFERPFVQEGKSAAFTSRKGEELSLRSARESMVLLKNDGILPLAPKYKKIAVIGYHGGTVRGMFGGYTNFSMYEGLLGELNTMAGLASGEKKEREVYSGTSVQKEDAYAELFEKTAAEMFPHIRPLAQELQTRFPQSKVVYAKGYDFAGDDESGFDSALAAAKDADILILTLGGKCGTGARCSMGENVNSANIGLPPAQEKFLTLAAKLGKPMVGVHFDGRPVSSDAADKYLGAILEGWNPSTYGAQAAADILTGAYNPSGKLPVSIAYSSGQYPMYYSHPFGSSYHGNEFYMGMDIEYIDSPFKPRYYFGHGLGYTKFEYRNLKTDKKEFSCGDGFSVSAEIANIGKRDGEEIVQLYCRDVCASVARPNMELIGFARVCLKSGETKKVRFDCHVNQFAFYDKGMRLKVEKGEVEILLGASSNDIRLQEKIMINSDFFIENEDKVFFSQNKSEN